MRENGMDPINIYVVEDQPKILKNLMKLLNGFDEIKVIGKAMSG